ncbi:MAG: hypothetical protein ACFFB3_20610, partial [Candidatus Hodarchaeota archaeon]
MASREVRNIRVELPHTAAIFCAVIQQPGKRGFDLDFIQDGKVIHKEMSVEKDADLVVELLVTAQIEFVSFSAVYQAGDLIVEAMEKLEAGGGEIIEEISEIVPTEETDDREGIVDEITADDELVGEISSLGAAISDTEEMSEDASLEIEPREGDIDESTIPEEAAPALEPTQPLKEMSVKYSEAIVQLYYDETAKEFSVAVWDKNEIKLDRTVIPNVEDAILDVLLSANLELQSMSVLFDVAAEIKGIVDDPTPFLKPEKPEYGDFEAEEDLRVEAEAEEELPDVSLLKEPSDVEAFITITKKSLQLERQILIREEPIKDIKGASCRIYRKGDDEWFLGFITKGEEETRAKKLPEVNLDDVARAMNNGIPQISFSMLYDAAEELYAVI